jgi:tight adherence protein B
MGALIGFLAGLGVLLIGWAVIDPGWRPPRRSRRRTGRIADLLARAGVDGIRPAQLVGMCAVAFVVVAVAMTGISGVPAIGVVFAAMAGAAAQQGHRGEHDTDGRGGAGGPAARPRRAPAA